MNMPGFKGDLSLYKSTTHYQTAAQSISASGSAITMALPIRNGGGGNGGTRCTPHCGPCLPDSSFPSGCSKECITVACEDVSISCTGCTCPAGLSRCGTRCVNLNNDPRNCGTCGTICSSGTCTNGTCALCPPGLIPCYNTVFHTFISCCPPGQCCNTGQCTCGGKCCNFSLGNFESCCSGKCANIWNDPQNCGACGKVCPTPANSSATCTTSGLSTQCGFTCNSGFTQCGNSCSDLTTDPQNCGTCGNVCSPTPANSSATCTDGVCDFVCNPGFTRCGNVCCNSTCTGTVPGVLYSNSNYIFDSACQNIVGLSVTLNVTQDMMSDNGFTVQVNANSPSGTEVDAYQQYGFSVTGNSIQGFINNWANVSTQVVCGSTGLASTPISNGLPAGYSLVLQLLNDSSGNVTGANYQVFDNNGVIVGNNSFLVQNAGCNCGGTCLGFKPGDLSPITAFTVDIVGPGNGQGTTFSSGAGSMTYDASSGQIGPLSSLPACIETALGTAETSNVAYETLNGCPKQSVTQPFSIKTRTCTQTNGKCTGRGGSPQCITVNGVSQCCHSNWLYGWYPWIIGCSDGQVEDQGCSGPCY